MGLNIGKYRFNSKEQAESKIEGLGIAQDQGVNYPTHEHTVVEIGFEILEEPVYGEENVISEAVFGESYLVDVLWRDLVDHPYGWKSYEVDVETEGIHGFSGLKYQNLKFE
jgi:hypothetical protein|tara:strand:+ start:640 stop:972 length:333 start_codon:yes stop_codon:yes gene_type:complete